jgi:hypothetical protein
MREAELRAQRQADMNRVALIIRQLEFVQLRMQALESVIAEVAKPMFEKDPTWLTKRLDEKHMEYLSKAAEEARVMAEKAKEEARKPKLTIVGANGLH